MVTCRQLIDAARKVFARDGFERARLEDIASSIGKTRGALYAHFRDKEDLFFAIFEQDLERDQKFFAETFNRSATAENAMEVFSRYLTEIVSDRQRMLLMLEFKLYAIRHPKRRMRLAILHDAACKRSLSLGLAPSSPGGEGLDGLMGSVQAARLSALVDGLGLNRIFDAEGLKDDLVLQCVQQSVCDLFSNAGGTVADGMRA